MCPIVPGKANLLKRLECCRDTMKDFKNSPAGREVLKAAMTQLLLYYTRLLELLRRSGGDGVGLARDAVTVQSIMYEIKRYNRT